MRVQGPGVLTFEYTDNDGVEWELKGDVRQLVVKEESTYEDLYSDYDFNPISRFVNATTYSAEFDVKSGQAFQIKKKIPKTGATHFVKMEIEANTKAEIDRAHAAIKPPADAAIVVGELDGAIYFVAEWAS